MLSIKRIYEKASAEDGYRILVDRLWPRGVSKYEADLYKWVKEIAPGSELRKEFGHEAEKFKWFAKEYVKELNNNPVTDKFVEEVKALLSHKSVTLLYGAKDNRINHALVLKGYIENKLE